MPISPPRPSSGRPLRRPSIAFLTAPLVLMLTLVLSGCSTDASASSVVIVAAAPGTTALPTAVATAVVLPLPAAPPPRQPVVVPPPVVQAESAIVVDDASGAVLYNLDAHRPLPPASLTKIATAALAIDRGHLDDWVTIDFDYTEPQLQDATVMGLQRGDRFTLRDLLYGMLLPSGADAAIAIGRAVSGSDQAFVDNLNTFMQSIGLRDSHFIDPHGLGGPGHVASAYDIAMLSRYAMRQPLFAKIVGTEVWHAVGSRTIEVWNTDPWAFSYPGGDGVKSGFTEEAGPTLSASATRDGHRVFVVILNSASREQDTTALMDWAFKTFCWDDGTLGCVSQQGSAASPAP